jgi:hypothetical protein
MFSDFDLSALVDAVAVRMAEHLKSDLSVANAGTIRPWLLDVEQAAVGCTAHSVRHQIKASKLPIVRCESARDPRRRGSR